MFGRKKPPAPIRRVPTDTELQALPLVRPGEFELSDREVTRLRRRIYGLNRENAWWTWRTVRHGPLLLIWRLEK
jgi:hypothetical protein